MNQRNERTSWVQFIIRFYAFEWPVAINVRISRFPRWNGKIGEKGDAKKWHCSGNNIAGFSYRFCIVLLSNVTSTTMLRRQTCALSKFRITIRRTVVASSTIGDFEKSSKSKIPSVPIALFYISQLPSKTYQIFVITFLFFSGRLQLW